MKMEDREIDEMLARYYRWTRTNTPISGLGYPRCSSPANRIPHAIDPEMPVPLNDREAEVIARMIKNLRKDEKQLLDLRYSRLPEVMSYRDIGRKMRCGSTQARTIKEKAFARFGGMLSVLL